MKYKAPMFVFNRNAYKNNLAALQNAFKQRMKRFKVGYSFKTNPHPLILRAALESGCYAEVVSPFEYDKAIQAGFSSERIIYNGVCKDPMQAVQCAKKGIVNVDSIAEIEEMSKCSRGDVLRIGARLTFDIGNDVVSRFGIPVGSDDFRKLIDIDKHSKNIRIAGISCHCTHARSADSWEKRAKAMADAAGLFKNIRYIDLGGNMYSPMDVEFKKNFPEHVSFDEYAEAICGELKDIDADLILEAGTPLVANAVDLCCEVIAVKKNSGKTFVVVNTSSYDIGIVCKHTSLNYDVKKRSSVSSDGPRYDKADVVGYTCIEDDVICKNFSSQVSVGDTIIFHNVGAYSYSFASDFIMPKHRVIERGDL